MPEVARALEEARAEAERPTLIVARTTIGFGSPNKAGTSKAHGEPLGVDEVRLTKEALGWPTEPSFYVPGEVYEHMQQAKDSGGQRQREWNELLGRYRAEHPELAERWEAVLTKKLPADWSQALKPFAADPKAKGTRVASGELLNTLSKAVPSLLGGSADLATSNNTAIKDAGTISGSDFTGPKLFFGVREHAMAAAMNGMALHGGVIPYGGTFLTFSDYMRPAIRLAALMHAQVAFVFTHDSVGLGEDGPTHQPVEHVMSLRLIPNLHVFRPGDANEVAMAWRHALERRDGPTAIILSRQNVPTLDREQVAPAEGALRGAYVLRDAEGAQVALLATGSELSTALDAADLLAERGVAARVVSMPCWELFAAQDQAYRDSVLPPGLTARVAVEAGRALGWERYVGDRGAVVGVERFGFSAPFQQIYKHFGLTPEHVAEVAQGLLG
jgi:transketolase